MIIHNNEIMVRIDNVGRVIIPKKLRESLGIFSESYLKIKFEENKLVLTKHEEKYNKYISFAKVWCDSYGNDTVIIFNNKKVLSIYGKKKNEYLYKNINCDIYNHVLDRNFSYIEINDYNLFYDCENVNGVLISLRDGDNSIGGLIIITENRINIKPKLLFKIINSVN